MNDPYKLVEICKSLISRKDLQPNYPERGVTHCNQFIDEALTIWMDKNTIGREFHGLMANSIVDKLAQDKDWQPFDVEDLPKYQGLISAGHPAIAGERGTGHGHVCLVIVGAAVDSGKWKCKAPLAANVGKQNWVGRGLNFAFHNKPKIWILAGQNKNLKPS